METFSALLSFVRGIHRSPLNSPHKGQWRGALMFSLVWAWINRWVNNGEAGDFRRYRAHYDVIVMTLLRWGSIKPVCQFQWHIAINPFNIVGLFYWQRLTEIRGLNKCSVLLVYLSEADRKYPNSKIHGANMGPVWGRHDPGGSHVGPMNFGIWVWSFLSRPAGNIAMNTINVWRVTYH